MPLMAEDQAASNGVKSSESISARDASAPAVGG